jgi:glycosyltransferase involved in cell wall biosynthesis
VIGGVLEIPGIEISCRPWRPETEVDDLIGIDVGLMPLPDDEWSRGKCGMKALQYMALKIPPVVSPIGANATIVAHGSTGFHACNEDEWVDRLTSLLGDAALRNRMGVAARCSVEADYSSKVHAPRLARLLWDIEQVP